VYRKEYNVTFFGLENLHPFDSKKWAHIYKVSQWESISYSILTETGEIPELNRNSVLYLLLLIFKRKIYINILFND